MRESACSIDAVIHVSGSVHLMAKAPCCHTRRTLWRILFTHQRYESFVTRVQVRHPLCVTVGTPMGSQWDPSGTLLHNSFGISCRSSAFGTRLGLKRDIVAQSPEDFLWDLGIRF